LREKEGKRVELLSDYCFGSITQRKKRVGEGGGLGENSSIREKTAKSCFAPARAWDGGEKGGPFSRA